jgi:hypothetical protein
MTPSNIHDVAKTAIQAEHKAQRTGTPVAREESEPEPAPKEKGGFLQKAADKVRKAVFADDDEDEAGDDEEASGLKALEVAQAGLAKAAERARERRASMPSAEEVEARNPLV